MPIQLKRAYDKPARTDGIRILVDRVWPRGVSKSSAKIDHWLKDIAPSTALRKWFSHDPAKWATFKDRYAKELEANPHAVAELRKVIRQKRVTLVYGAKDETHNQAVALIAYLRRRKS